MRRFRFAVILLLAGAAASSSFAAAAPANQSPPQSGYNVFPVEQIQSAKVDILADAALKDPGGASYEFFAGAMPPLRYCDTNFAHYPITLSAPGSKVKARFVSNGSAINALGRQQNWKGETGIPVEFFVGDARERFGEALARLDGPRYAEGYLPIVQLAYACGGVTYTQEALASTTDELKENAVVFVKLGVKGGVGRVEAKYENAVYEVFKFADGTLSTPEGKALALLSDGWKHYPGRGSLVIDLKDGESAYMAIWTKPVGAESVKFKANSQIYESQRKQCANTWNELLSQITKIDVGEAVVMNAWRASIIGNFMLLHGDEMRYSQGNQYAKLYIGEGGDTVRATALYGQLAEARKMIPPLFNYTRKGLEFHQAAFKLQMLAHYYLLTRDVEFIKSLRPMWEKEINVILSGREKSSGMLPREKYCGDIDTMVYSLNSNSNCWRALRDWSIVTKELGEDELSANLHSVGSEYRQIILQHVSIATNRSVDPPFVPVALSGEEKPGDPIWATLMGSYWNLMIEYILGSGVFTPESETATDITKYLQQKGGLCMGMVRARESMGWWVSGGRINDLYGMRYALLLQRRDEVDRALVSFYGKLAQGFTRDTFIGCEGSSIGSPDGWGRQMYLPPNSAANASFLQQLRYLLVQDYDLDDDGREETLRLAFATPRRWLEDGKRISVTKAPTAFGEVSYEIRRSGKSVAIEVDLPPRAPKSALLRLRLPEGDQLIDLTGKTGHVSLTAAVP